MPVADRTTAPAPAVAAPRRRRRRPGAGAFGGCGLRREPLLLLLLPLVAGSGDALWVNEQGDDQRDAADGRAQLPDRPSHSSKAREQALRRTDARDDRPGDHRDAPKYVNAMRPSAASAPNRV